VNRRLLYRNRQKRSYVLTKPNYFKDVASLGVKICSNDIKTKYIHVQKNADELPYNGLFARTETNPIVDCYLGASLFAASCQWKAIKMPEVRRISRGTVCQAAAVSIPPK